MNDVIEIDTWIQNKINSFFDKYINYYYQEKNQIPLRTHSFSY